MGKDKCCCGSGPESEPRSIGPESLSPGACSCGGPDIPRAPIRTEAPQSECCGPGPVPPLGIHVPPGTDHPHMVDGWVAVPEDIQEGRAPRIRTALQRRDQQGTILARLGVTRHRYTVAPGLYAVGDPGQESPVLVSANYKLSFDALRKELSGLDLWLLVLDTRGINVWCSAGKRTFSAEEVARMARLVGLDRVVSHRTLILPQLAAPGVSALAVRRACGFQVAWGPVRASDLPAYLRNGRHADPSMRRVSFTLAERAVLVPVEFWVMRKAASAAMFVLIVLAGLAAAFLPPDVALAWIGAMVLGLVLGGLAGGALVPLLLPWLPGRSFWLKGLAAGLGAFLAVWLLLPGMSGLGAGLVALALAGWMGMNFTGATPFTSPSGVEKEMRRGIPVQLALSLCGLALWLAGPFV